MRGRRSKAVQAVARAITRVVRGEGGQLADPVRETAQAALSLALRSNGLTVDRVISKVSDKLGAVRHQTVAGVAIEADDNDAQLRAAELGLRLHERAGTIPSERETSRPTGARARLIQIDPDGTERIIEIAT